MRVRRKVTLRRLWLRLWLWHDRVRLRRVLIIVGWRRRWVVFMVTVSSSVSVITVTP